jgi:hypothetical protein
MPPKGLTKSNNLAALRALITFPKICPTKT